MSATDAPQLLWVDDLRPPPTDVWKWAKTSFEAITALETDRWDTMSLDHDLGANDTTRAVVLWLCEHNDRWPSRCFVHSANPVGRSWLLGMIERYQPARQV